MNPDQMIYFVQVDFGGDIGLSWVERDPARMDRKTTVADIADRQFGFISKILECNPVEHICSDVTGDLLTEAQKTFSHDYRTPFTGQDKIDWENDRRRALEMV